MGLSNILNIRKLLFKKIFKIFKCYISIFEENEKLRHFIRFINFPGGSDGKVSASMRETRVQSLGREDPLEKERATHSSTLAWKILWAEEPGRLRSMGSQRIRHD